MLPAGDSTALGGPPAWSAIPLSLRRSARGADRPGEVTAAFRRGPYATRMRNSEQFFAELLALESPWRVAAVHFRVEAREVVVEVECEDEGLRCPECGARSPRHDERRRRHEHLETMGFRTIVSVKRPRIRCGRHGVQRISAPLPSFTPPTHPTRGRFGAPGAD